MTRSFDLCPISFWRRRLAGAFSLSSARGYRNDYRYATGVNRQSVA
jgi:hypothetical protein